MEILVSLTGRSQLRYFREYIVQWGVGCGLSKNMLIKGQFKIKDSLMEKKHDLGLSHSRLSVIIVFKHFILCSLFPKEAKDCVLLFIAAFLVFFN